MKKRADQGSTDSWELASGDESVGHFLERMLGDRRPVDNIVSAMMHGIHGGDVYKLSVKSTMFDQMWYKNVGPRHSQDGVFMDAKELALLADIMDGPNRTTIIEMAEKAIYQKMLAFEDGLLTLQKGLRDDLKKQPNVTIKCNSPVKLLSRSGNKITVRPMHFIST